MIIIPRLSENLLELFTFTYRSEEFEILSNFLNDNEIKSESTFAPNDNYSRLGRIFNIQYNQQIQRFESLLGVKFLNQGPKTVTKVEEEYTEGSTYRCIRIAHSPSEKGCKNIYAINDAAAFIKCNLIANELNWFAAEKEHGKCKEKSFWNPFS